MPKLSIITINYNNLAGLQKTMQSVFEQTFTDYEYIIIDGGSKDGSKEYIEQFADKLAYWVSESDEGIYDALNKGSRIAKGEFLHHLNSGDIFHSKHALSLLFRENPMEDFVYCNQDLPGYYLKQYPDTLSYNFFCRDAVPHQATVIKRSFFEVAGPFSEAYRMGGDYKFFLEAVFLKQCSYRHVPITLTSFDMSGISTTHSEQLRNEFTLIREESLPNLVKEFEKLYSAKKRLELVEKSRAFRFIKLIRQKLGIE